MNNEKARSVDIIFNRGVRQDLDPHTAPPGSLVSCQNLEFDQLGRLVKRDGYALLGTTALSNGLVPDTQIRRVLQSPDGDRLLMSDDTPFVYFPTYDKVSQTGLSGFQFATRASMTDVSGIAGDNNGGLGFSDCIAVGSIAVYIYTQANAYGGGISVFADVVDVADGGTRILSRVSLGATAGNYPPRLVVSGGSSVVFAIWEHSTTTTLKFAKLDLSVTPIAWGATSTFTTTSGPCIFDACQLNSGWALVYYDTNTQLKAVVNTYDSTPSQLHQFIWLANGGALQWTPTALTISGNATFTTSNIRVVGYDPATQFLESKVLTASLASVATGRVNPGLGAVKHVRAMSSIATSSLGSVVAFSNYTSSSVSTNPRGHLYCRTIDDTAVLSVAATLYNYSLASRFYLGSVGSFVTLLMARFDDPSGLQNHLALFDYSSLDPKPICHFASGRVPLKSDNAVTGMGGIIDLSTIRGGLFRYASTVNIGASQYSGNQIQSWTFQALGTQRYLATPCQRELVLGGGTPIIYDGQNLVELGFYSYPVLQSGNTTPSAAGGSIAQGVYQYRAVYEWTDIKGNRQQSPASPAVTVDLSSATYVAGTASVAFSLASMFGTYKGGTGPVTPGTTNTIQIVFYRTLAGQSTFYRVPGGAASGAVNATTTFTDTYPDASISGNEPVYERNGGQGLLSSTAPPPSIVLTTHAGRLWGVDCENPERIWCTRVLQPEARPHTTRLYRS